MDGYQGTFAMVMAGSPPAEATSRTTGAPDSFRCTCQGVSPSPPIRRRGDPPGRRLRHGRTDTECRYLIDYDLAERW